MLVHKKTLLSFVCLYILWHNKIKNARACRKMQQAQFMRFYMIRFLCKRNCAHHPQKEPPPTLLEEPEEEEEPELEELSLRGELVTCR